jgi:hypothetical protein
MKQHFSHGPHLESLICGGIKSELTFTQLYYCV